MSDINSDYKRTAIRMILPEIVINVFMGSGACFGVKRARPHAR